MIDLDPYYLPLLGGIMIGLSAAGMYLANGRVMGVSGIVNGVFVRKSWDLYWRILFLIGLFTGSFFIEPLGFSIMQEAVDRPLVLTAIGGLLVGLGTTIGNGCTSGHGVCGIGRFSVRSIVATIVFMTAGIITVYILNHLLGYTV